MKIFYFISDKIYFEKKLDNKIKKNYKSLFVDIPLKIINQHNENDKILFFIHLQLILKLIKIPLIQK